MLSKIKVVFILFIISVLSSCTFIRLIQNGVIDEELELKTGTTLAVYDDMAVIGTNAYGAWGGYVLILRCLNGKWKEEAVFEMEKIAYGFRGPCSLSASENYIAIGLDNKKNKPGAVIILYRNSNGKWEPGQKLYGKQKQPDDLFGMSVSLCNNKLAVGAPGNERTYLYRLDERECILEQILAPDSFAGDSKFGNYVSLNDDMLYVGQCGFKSLS